MLLLVIREIKIKTMRYSDTATKMAKIKTFQYQCRGGRGAIELNRCRGWYEAAMLENSSAVS